MKPVAMFTAVLTAGTLFAPLTHADPGPAVGSPCDHATFNAVTTSNIGTTDQDAERVAARNQWQDHGLVFASEFGTPVEPRNILRTIQIAAQKAGMSDIGVHTLRHGAAVAWLESGVHIKAVADLLGHSSITITGDIYGHTSDDMARSAVDGLAGQLGLLD